MPPDDLAAADFATFARVLGDHLDLDSEGWRPEDELADAVGWDSLMAAEVVAWLEDRGVRLPDELLDELRTLADLHHYSQSLAPAPDGRPPAPRRPLHGRRVRLVPFTGAHHAEALDLFTRDGNLVRFRLRGTTPSPEAFGRVLWDRVLAQFVVVDASRMVAVVSAFEPDLRNRHVHVAVISRPDAPPGAGAEGLALLVDHLFTEFDLRKVYAETLEPNTAEFASAFGRVAEVEGRLVDHEYMGGRYHDMLILAVTRDRWEPHAERLLGPAPA